MSIFDRIRQRSIIVKAATKPHLVKKALLNSTNGLDYIRYRLQHMYLTALGQDPESITFYRHLQNRKVMEGEAYPRGQGIGKAQIEFLQRMGVRPSESLLDIGCGNLRGGRYMIDYLGSGNYTGMDISEEAIKQAWQTVHEEDFRDQAPRLLVNDDLQFREFESEAFDAVFANSVLTHLSKEYIATCFDNLPRILTPHGRAYLSYNHHPEGVVDLSNNIASSNLYAFPFEELQELGEEYGLHVEYDDYAEHPAERMRMLVVEAP